MRLIEYTDACGRMVSRPLRDLYKVVFREDGTADVTFCRVAGCFDKEHFDKQELVCLMQAVHLDED